MSKKFVFWKSCVQFHGASVDDLIDYIDGARKIQYKTFLSHVYSDQFASMAKDLGYSLKRSDGLVIQDDYTVSFYASKYKKHRVYFFKWSAIEHIYVNERLIDRM